MSSSWTLRPANNPPIDAAQTFPERSVDGLRRLLQTSCLQITQYQTAMRREVVGG